MAFKLVLFTINFSFLLFFPFSILTILFALSTCLLALSLVMHKEMTDDNQTSVKNVDTKRR